MAPKNIVYYEMYLVVLTIGYNANYCKCDLFAVGKIFSDVENSSVQDVLSIIEQKSAFYFTYNVNQINTQRKVSITIEDKTVTEVLDQLFEKEGVKYLISDKHIVLYKADKAVPALENINQQKGITISGVVKDSNGNQSSVQMS